MPFDPSEHERRERIRQREAQAVVLTANLLRSQGHQVTIGTNRDTGEALMQTELGLDPAEVLEAIARSWIMMGEPNRRLACINHFAQPGGALLCGRRSCAEIAAAPTVGCLK